MRIDGFKCLFCMVLVFGATAIVIGQPITPTDAYLQLKSSIEQQQWERARLLAAQLMENGNVSSEADSLIGTLIRRLKEEDIDQSVVLAQKRFSILLQRAPRAIRQRITIAERAEELGN